MGWKGRFTDYLAGLSAPDNDAARAIVRASGSVLNVLMIVF